MSVTKGPTATVPAKSPVAKRKTAKPNIASPATLIEEPVTVVAEAEIEAVAPLAAEAPLVAPEVTVPEVTVTESFVGEALPPPLVISEPVSEAPVSVVETTIASPPTPIFQQKVKFMATLTPPFKGYEDFAAFGKANIEAFVQANSILAKGVEEFSKEIVSLTQASMESAAAAAKAVLAAKTLKDMVELQADFSKTSFDKFVANSSKLSELGVKVASDAIAPVTARVNVAVEKVLKPAA